jgi:hypothetical protein
VLHETEVVQKRQREKQCLQIPADQRRNMDRLLRLLDEEGPTVPKNPKEIRKLIDELYGTIKVKKAPRLGHN